MYQVLQIVTADDSGYFENMIDRSGGYEILNKKMLGNVI